MSLWGVFIVLVAVAVLLSLGAAVVRPRDRAPGNEQIDADDPVGGRSQQLTSITQLQARVDALEADVDDLQRAVTALREENEYLQQRIDSQRSDPPSGEFS